MSRVNVYLQSIFFSLALVVLASGVWAADAQPSNDTHELAKASQNPMASLISVPFENNSTFNNGTEDVYVNILNIKPVIPMGITENFNLINHIARVKQAVMSMIERDGVDRTIGRDHIHDSVFEAVHRFTST